MDLAPWDFSWGTCHLEIGIFLLCFLAFSERGPSLLFYSACVMPGICILSDSTLESNAALQYSLTRGAIEASVLSKVCRRRK
jgi:hypothetical protein